MDALNVNSDKACVWHYVLPEITPQITPDHDLNMVHAEECTTAVSMPNNIPSLIQEFGHDLPCFTEEEVDIINQSTMGQADCTM